MSFFPSHSLKHPRQKSLAKVQEENNKSANSKMYCFVSFSIFTPEFSIFFYSDDAVCVKNLKYYNAYFYYQADLKIPLI